MRRIRLGMVGGGQGAFIGAVHRIAARLDDRYELVAGAFSADPARGRDSAAALHIAPDRAYATYAEMAEREAARPDRVDVVSIVTPNHLHHGPAKAFLQAGVHVICDKPLCHTLDDALDLEATARSSPGLFALTHNYTGYPMVRQAREMVAGGELGEVRVVQVEYPQEWLTTKLEDTGQKQAAWRTDPQRSGAAGSVGDIGTHAFNLAEFVTGLEVESLAADLTAFVPGRTLDDNAHMLLRFARRAGGALVVAGGTWPRERAAAAGVWREGRAGLVAGAAERAGLHPLRRADAPDPPGRRRRVPGGGPCQPHPRRAPRGLPGGLCPALPRLCRADRGALGRPRPGPGLPAGAGHRRRRARDAVHRRRSRVKQGRCRLDKGRMMRGMAACLTMTFRWSAHGQRCSAECFSSTDSAWRPNGCGA